MPQLANAKKALRQNKKKAGRNKIRRDEVHSLRRTFRKLLEADKVDEAKDFVKLLDKKVDKAAKDNLITKNAAARTKSRYMAKLNAATADKTK